MRVNYINSLKGICCLLVFIGHMSSLFFPYVYFGTNYAMHSQIEKYLFETPINILFNAPSALMCFLLLSGFLLPLSTFSNNGKVAVLSKWGEKYVRLAPMAILGCVLGWIVMKMDVVYSLRITDLTFSRNYTEWFNNFVPGNLLLSDGPLYDALINTFFDGCRYNAPLGTLKYIWIFSLLLLGLNKFCLKWKFRYILYMFLFAVSYLAGKYKYEYFYFGIMLLGLFICDIYYNPYKKYVLKRNSVLGILCMIVGFILASVPKGYPEHGFYHYFGYIHVTHYVFWAFGWGLIVIAVENLFLVRRVLENKVFLWVGDISFAVFAVHWPITISLSSWMVLKGVQHTSYMRAALFSMFLTVGLVIGVAWIVQHKVYKPLCQIEKGIIKKLENE